MDDETLAAFIDGALDDATRKRVERHLADCDDCYEILAESVRLRTAGDAEGLESAVEEAGRRSPHLRHGMGVIGLLAAAAVAWLVVAPPEFIGRWQDPHSRPELKELVAAVGGARPTLGRLTGGFGWGPPPTPLRGGSPGEVPPRIRLAAARLEQALQRQRSARTLAASGVARLVSGRPEEAVTMLEASVDLDPSDPAVWNDLSAAYVASASGAGGAARLQQALEAANTSTRLDPSRAEPWFNKALVLERLARRDEARAAWQRFIDLEGPTPWSEEAQQHLKELGFP